MIFYFLSKGGKSLKDEDKLASFDIKDGGRLYFKDLGKIVIIICQSYMWRYSRINKNYDILHTFKQYAHIFALSWVKSIKK